MCYLVGLLVIWMGLISCELIISVVLTGEDQKVSQCNILSVPCGIWPLFKHINSCVDFVPFIVYLCFVQFGSRIEEFIDDTRYS